MGEGELLKRSSPSPNPTPLQELSHRAPSNVKAEFEVCIGRSAVGKSFLDIVVALNEKIRNQTLFATNGEQLPP